MEKLVEQLELHEGKENKVYEDTEGVLTIGYGRNLEDKGLSDKECELLLRNDIKECKRDMENYFWYISLDDIRKRVILDMRYNLGLGGLLSFKNMIKALKEKDYMKASQEMLDSKWADQVKTRATRLAKMMETGEDYG